MDGNFATSVGGRRRRLDQTTMASTPQEVAGEISVPSRAFQSIKVIRAFTTRVLILRHDLTRCESEDGHQLLDTSKRSSTAALCRILRRAGGRETYFGTQARGESAPDGIGVPRGFEFREVGVIGRAQN